PQIAGVQRLVARWKLQPAQYALNLRAEAGRDEPQPLGEPRRAHQPDGDRFAVLPRVAADLLDGVGEGMPQVEEGAYALFGAILVDQRDLDARRAGDDRVVGWQRIGGEFFQQGRIGDQRGLDDFRQPAAPLD